ncbi:MAG: PHP domain-containing protein [Ruminiclostridium sp.]|nr:PHP domain-containing protein [Ruminiclostridium sp.]
MNNTIDLHMHSAASDGTDAPEELAAQIRRAGLRVFSLTDHDTLDGCIVLMDHLPENLTFIPGIEFSCIAQGKKCHILGYGYDPKAPSMAQALEAGRALRMEKLNRRLRHLDMVHGIRFSGEDLDWLFSLNSPGKPHLAQLIVRHNRAENAEEAIRTYIDGCKGGDDRIDAELAIRGILEAGGIPVWAHPLGGEGEKHISGDEFSARLRILMGLGIQGLECFYSRYTREEEAFLLQEAQRHNLLVSGGSDYHGTAMDIPLGMLSCSGQTVQAHDLTILERFA